MLTDKGRAVLPFVCHSALELYVRSIFSSYQVRLYWPVLGDLPQEGRDQICADGEASAPIGLVYRPGMEVNGELVPFLIDEGFEDVDPSANVGALYLATFPPDGWHMRCTAKVYVVASTQEHELEVKGGDSTGEELSASS